MPRIEQYSFGRIVVDGEERRRDLIVLRPGRRELVERGSALSDGTLACQLQRLAELPPAAVVIEARYSVLYKLEHVDCGWLADQLARLAVRGAGIPGVW